MICASCHGTTDDDVCSSCGESALLDARYRLDELLGSGASGMTFRARSLETGDDVAIKELDWRKLDALKTEELFNREAAVLRQLEHPGIPHYIETFTRESGRHISAYLVQEFIDGKTLHDEQQDRRYALDDVLAIAEELLEIVSYLHARTPPVFHRDIKPKNVMRRKAGDLVLIDFGSVREVARPEGGSTIAGTVGYMAPEQLSGQAVPGSDLFGVGALICALVSGVDPSNYLGMGTPKLWENFIDVPGPVEELLRVLLAPDVDDRADDARFVQQWVRDLRTQLGAQVSSSAKADFLSALESRPVRTPAKRSPAPASRPDIGSPPRNDVSPVFWIASAVVTAMMILTGVYISLDTPSDGPTFKYSPPPVPKIDRELPGELGAYGGLGETLEQMKPLLAPTDDPNTWKLTPVIARFHWDCELTFWGEETEQKLSSFECTSPQLQQNTMKSRERMTKFLKRKYGEPSRTDGEMIFWGQPNVMMLKPTEDGNRLELQASVGM
jgi:serine/threonine protein kinase